MPKGIIIFGANGCGKTTLGRELARVLCIKHMDIEDYHFVKSEIPYTEARSHDECLRLMLADIEKYGTFVLSAVTGDFDETICATYILGVHITAPVDIRIERIAKREAARHEKRICAGGDMFDQHREFLNFAASRSLATIENWAKELTCPVIQVDGARDVAENVRQIAAVYSSLV